MRELYFAAIERGKTVLIDEESLQMLFDEHEEAASALHQQSIEALATQEGTRMEGSTYARVLPSGIVVMSLFGPIYPRANMMTMSGATSIEAYTNDFVRAYDNPGIPGIINRIDSPGGDVRNISEASYTMYELIKQNKKPVYSYAEGYMCSAAYYVGSTAQKIFAGPMSSVGSIGVVMTVRMKDDKTIEITSSKNKRPDVSTEEGRKGYQDNVYDMADVFRADVAKHRKIKAKDVEANYGEGLVFIGETARTQGLVDEIVPTFSHVITAMEKEIKVRAKSGNAKAEGQVASEENNEEGENNDMGFFTKAKEAKEAKKNEATDEKLIEGVEGEDAAAQEQPAVVLTRADYEDKFESAAENFSLKMVMGHKIFPAQQLQATSAMLNAMVDDAMAGGQVNYIDAKGDVKAGTRAEMIQATYDSFPKHTMTQQAVTAVKQGQSSASVLTEMDEEKETVAKVESEVSAERKAKLLSTTNAGRAALRNAEAK